MRRIESVDHHLFGVRAAGVVGGLHDERLCVRRRLHCHAMTVVLTLVLSASRLLSPKHARKAGCQPVMPFILSVHGERPSLEDSVSGNWH